MYRVFEALKNFILTDMAVPLSYLETEKCPLPVPLEKNIIFGTADLSRNEAKQVVAIVPDRATVENAGSLSDGGLTFTVVVCFACRGANYATLMAQMDGYSTAFRQAIRSNQSLGGAVDDVEIADTEYFPDAGSTHGTMTAVEIELTIKVTESRTEGTDPFEEYI